MQLAEQQGEALLHDVERVDAVADDSCWTGWLWQKAVAHGLGCPGSKTD
jgi:hypothetical protein